MVTRCQDASIKSDRLKRNSSEIEMQNRHIQIDGLADWRPRRKRQFSSKELEWKMETIGFLTTYCCLIGGAVCVLSIVGCGDLEPHEEETTSVEVSDFNSSEDAGETNEGLPDMGSVDSGHVLDGGAPDGISDVGASDGIDTTDTGDTNDSGTDVPEDPAAAEVVSTNVEADATRVSVWTVLSAEVSVEAASTSLTDETVTLVDEDGGQVDGTISLDGDGTTITFDPTDPLEYGTRYTWTLDSVEAASGAEFPSLTLAFTTYINPRVQEVRYSSGEISAILDSEYDDNGNRTRTLVFSDGELWGADDDVMTGYYLWSYDEDDRLVREIYYSFTDGEWAAELDGSGDEPWRYKDFTYDSDGNLLQRVMYDGPGDDETWFDGSDTVSIYSAFLYNESGLKTQSARCIGFGEDGSWFNEDDDCDRTDTTYDEHGNKMQVIESTLGEVTGYQTYDRNAEFQLVRKVSYVGPGTDGHWFEAEDEASDYVAYEYDDRGNLTLRVTYVDPGIDGDWYTDDDVRSLYSTYSHSDDNRSTGGASYDGAGLDGDWHTSDDDVYEHWSRQYEPHGSLVLHVVFDSPGVDGNWFTDDDAVEYEFKYVYTEDGNRELREWYRASGTGSDWVYDTTF